MCQKVTFQITSFMWMRVAIIVSPVLIRSIQCLCWPFVFFISDITLKRLCRHSLDLNSGTLATICRCCMSMIFADKKTNSVGLQLADLVARPIGLKIIRPGQENSAFEILANKLYSKNGRQGVGTGYEGYGLKCFP